MGIDGDQIPFAAYQQFHCFHPCHFQNFGGMMMGGGRRNEETARRRNHFILKTSSHLPRLGYLLTNLTGAQHHKNLAKKQFIFESVPLYSQVLPFQIRKIVNLISSPLIITWAQLSNVLLHHHAANLLSRCPKATNKKRLPVLLWPSSSPQ